MERITLIKNQLSNKEPLVTVENSNGDKRIKIVKLNNPKQLNVLTKELLDILYSEIIRLDTDDETKVIIITGNGKAFAAGANLKKFNEVDYSYMSKNDWDLLPIENISYQVTKPIIAAVNGFAFGGGFELALACDIIIASDKASFSFPELKVGLFPGAGGTQRLTKLIGYHKAFEYITTAKEFKLDELKFFGVINNIVPSEALLSSAHKMAEEMCKFSLIGLIASKKAIKLSQETNLFAGLKAEKYIFQGIFGSEDRKIGTSSFIEKKNAEFKDK